MRRSAPTEPSAPRRQRPATLGFLIAGGLAATGAVAIGVADNPPGIGLAYVAAILLVLAFVHSWRRRRKFGWLLLGSGLGFLAFVVLHNLLYAAEIAAEGVPVLPAVMGLLSALAFLVAVLLCPAASVVGLVGLLVTTLGGRPARRR